MTLVLVVIHLGLDPRGGISPRSYGVMYLLAAAWPWPKYVYQGWYTSTYMIYIEYYTLLLILDLGLAEKFASKHMFPSGQNMSIKADTLQGMWYIYISIIITVTWSEVLDHIKLTGMDHQIKWDAEPRVWSSDPRLSTRHDPALRIKLL